MRLVANQRFKRRDEKVPQTEGLCGGLRADLLLLVESKAQKRLLRIGKSM
jgi:hypothetical protein